MKTNYEMYEWARKCADELAEKLGQMHVEYRKEIRKESERAYNKGRADMMRLVIAHLENTIDIQNLDHFRSVLQNLEAERD